MDQQPLPASEAFEVPASPAPDARRRVSSGRYRATPEREVAALHLLQQPCPARSAFAQLDAAPVIGGGVVTVAAVVAFDLTLTERLSMFFDLCFILVGLCAAVLVHRRSLFAVGVLPPLLMGGVIAVVAATMPSAVTASHLAFVSTWLTGLAHHGAALVITHALVLAIVAARASARDKRGPRPAAPPPNR